MSEELREELNKLISLRINNALNLVEDLRERIQKREDSKEKVQVLFGKEGIYEPRDLLEVQHPVLRRGGFFDWGNLTRKLNKELRDLSIVDAVLSGNNELALKLADDLLTKVKQAALDMLLEKAEEGDDIRPMMMPGSVGRSEIPNLYIGEEEYSETDRMRLALQLVKSIGVGNSASVYFEGDFQEDLKDLIRKKFDKNYIEASDLKASNREMEQPFVMLMRLLIWIYEQLIEEDRAKIEELKSSSGIIYFVPKDRERYNAFYFPQLNRFVGMWLQDDSKREVLKSMLNSIARLTRQREVDKNSLELIYNNLNLLAYSLIETSSVEWEPLRRIVDSLIDIFDKLDLRVDLSFIRKLCGVHESSE